MRQLAIYLLVGTLGLFGSPSAKCTILQGTEGGPPAVAPQRAADNPGKKAKPRSVEPPRAESASDSAAAPPQPSQSAKTGSARSNSQAANPNSVPAKNAASPAPSSPEIATARSSGKVWVNLDSGVYHKGGRWYGKTKNGKFMTEAEAKAAGYKEAQKH